MNGFIIIIFVIELIISLIAGYAHLDWKESNKH